MKKLKLLLFLFSFIMLPNITYAGCTKEEIDYFKRIEEEFKINYDFDKESMSYNVYLHRPKESKYIYEVGNFTDNINGIFEEGNDEIIHLINVEPGTINIVIMGNSDTCDSVLKSYDINLAPYNYYSENPLCEGIEEFYLCQPTYDKEVDYDTFVSRVETYKKNRVVTTTKVENNRFSSNVIIDFLKENLFEIIVGTIFVIVVIVTIILTAKSIKKRRRLE